jgi:hypothetical protein
MIRIRLIAALCAVLSFAAGAVVPGLFAASSHAVALPVVQRQGPPVATALIYHCQCGAVIAWRMGDGRVLLTIQDHSRGGASIVGIDDGTTFRELPNQPSQARTNSPTFDFPGQKQGVGSAVQAFGGLIVAYAPSRTEDGGTYNVWRFVYGNAP